MSDILEQIQDLQEKFASLCEVEGLGEPSQEVPPSTNKLKKDVKTKNGKVELVSVENELFPYEGNKKEQFQQKVLDTINGMIQGTNTLEDLLQVVRSKKVAPVKEGIEEFAKAVEILEEIINEVSVGKLAKAAENTFDKRREIAKDSTEKSKKAYSSYEKQSKEHPEDEQALYNAVSKLSNIAHKDREKASHANDLVNLNLPKDSKVSANKLFDKADKTYDKRGKGVDKALEKGKGRGDKEFDTSMKKFSRAVDLATADPVVSRRTNGGVNEALENYEKAIEIIEGLFINDGRGDLLDDVSKALTNKTLKQHAQAAITKAVSGLTKKPTKKRK